MMKKTSRFTSYGNFMYNFTEKGITFLAKHKWLYYLLNLTWGIFLTFIGWIITLGLLMIGKKPTKYHGIYYIKIGDSWGGFETGLMFVRDKTSIEILNAHEYGHTYQNAIFGPFQIFLITIPSIIRYWYRELKYERKGITPKTDYDDIWFERSASNHGLIAIDIEDHIQNYKKKGK